jgi:hypothetical protein
MASKRHARWKECSRKVAYPNHRAAFASACHCGIQRGINLEVYRCRFGNHYHIGRAWRR